METIKKYIIIGSNNFWYASHVEKHEIKTELKYIKKNWRQFNGSKPDELYVFEAKEIKRINL
jgi:hypothetical protein